MVKSSLQALTSIVMIRPHHITPNAETAAKYAFQNEANERFSAAVSKAAHDEMSKATAVLSIAGVMDLSAA